MRTSRTSSFFIGIGEQTARRSHHARLACRTHPCEQKHEQQYRVAAASHGTGGKILAQCVGSDCDSRQSEQTFLPPPCRSWPYQPSSGDGAYRNVCHEAFCEKQKRMRTHPFCVTGVRRGSLDRHPPTPHSDAEAGTSFGSASTDDCAATACAHANQETMGTFTPGYRGLVCAFHGSRLYKKKNTRLHLFALDLSRPFFLFACG